MHVKYAKPLAPSRSDLCEAFHEATGAHIEADAVDHVVLLLHEELDRIIRETLPTYNEEFSVRARRTWSSNGAPAAAWAVSPPPAATDAAEPNPSPRTRKPNCGPARPR